MNSIHDLGGMHGFGQVAPEKDEPIFHEDWEKRVVGLALGLGAFGNLDRYRHEIERMNPVDYLSVSYYERWLWGAEVRTKQIGMLTEEELRTGIAAPEGRATEPPLPAGAVGDVLGQGAPTIREPERGEPRFKVGDRVLARELHPVGHTRLPRYVRGKQGIVDRIHGTHAFPDTNALELGEHPQPLYCVRFRARTLWGPEAPEPDQLYIDLWEDYLQPIGTER